MENAIQPWPRKQAQEGFSKNPEGNNSGPLNFN